mgnify:CR=1 FL=1
MDLRIPDNRAILLKDIKTPENKDRKDKSFEATEIYNGRLRQYVVEYLESQHSASSVKEMPVQTGTNLSRRIVSERASIYKEGPSRHFQNVSDDQEAVLNATSSMARRILQGKLGRMVDGLSLIHI